METRVFIQVAIFSAFGLASTVSNIVINIALYRLGRYRMIGHYFIWSLSWSDLYFGLFVVPLSVTELLIGTFVTTTTYWCKLTAGLALLAILGTSWNLALVSIDRFIAIYRPFLYQASVTVKRVLMTIFITWVIIGIWVFLPVMGWAHELDYKRAKLTLCVWPMVLDEKYFSITLVSVFVAVFIVLVLQSFIFIAARSQSRKIYSRENSFTLAKTRAAFISRQRKITRMVGFVVACFMLTYLPWAIILARNMLAGNASQNAILVSLCLVYFNSVANPWIYAFSDTKLRFEIRKLLCLKVTRERIEVQPRRRSISPDRMNRSRETKAQNNTTDS